MSISLRAVVVGVNAYADTRFRTESELRFARADAEAVADMLCRSTTYAVDRVDLLTDERASAAEVRNSLNAVFSDRAFGGNKIALFYFAGHGVYNPNDDRISLCCHDVDFSDPNSGGIRLNDIYDLLQRSSADCAIAIIDSCFSGGIIDLKRLDHLSAAERAKQAIEALRGRDGKTLALFAACRTSQRSREAASEGHGIYTAEVLRGWRDAAAQDGSGDVTLLSLANYLSKRFEADSQVPPYTILGNRPVLLWHMASPAAPRLPAVAADSPALTRRPPEPSLTRFDQDQNRIPTFTPPARPRVPVAAVGIALIVCTLLGVLSLVGKLWPIVLLAFLCDCIMLGIVAIQRARQ